jgi:hypothetical protein
LKPPSGSSITAQILSPLCAKGFADRIYAGRFFQPAGFLLAALEPPAF